jgi:hypothetical protein
MDILTPKGQVSLFDEQVVANWLSMRGTQYVQTDKDKPAKVDAIIFQKNTLIGVAETKCRYGLTLNKLQNSFNNEWLITEEKIKSGLAVANALCTRFFGILYLVNDDKLLTIDLRYAQRRVERTQTQATINGGLVVRENAFINMKEAQVYHDIKKQLKENRARTGMHG